MLASYVAQYRAPFFERATDQLDRRGITLSVAVGGVDDRQACRNDAVELPGQLPLTTRSLRFGGRELVWRQTRRLVQEADLVVMEQARRNVDAYVHLLGSHRRPVALWGHGRTTTRTTQAWEHRLLDGLTRRADWFFAYTERGRNHMVERGFPAGRVSVVQNATDTTGLRRDRAAVSTARQQALRAELGLTQGRTALFLGALDPSKRIGFLLAAAETLAAEMPGFTLVIAGDGPLRAAVEGVARTEPWLRFAGPVFGVDKAEIASVADVMLNPGRVGLTVVDSFALGLPMVTTDWPGHAPEFDYLEDGVNGVVTGDRLAEFVAATELLLTDTVAREDLQRGCAEAAERYRVEAMVERFVHGVQGALTAGPRRGGRSRTASQLTSAGAA